MSTGDKSWLFFLDIGNWVGNFFLSANERCANSFWPPLFSMGNLLSFELLFISRSDVMSLSLLSRSLLCI